MKANTRITNREYPVYSRALLIVGLELIPLEMEFILSISVMFLWEGIRSLPGLMFNLLIRLSLILRGDLLHWRYHRFSHRREHRVFYLVGIHVCSDRLNPWILQW